MPSAKNSWTPRVFVLAASVLLLGGCQQFFTFSLAKSLARAPSPLTSISADQAAALVAAKPDQALAASAVGALATLVTANPTSASVVSDAAQVAVIATGLDAALTQSLATVLTSGGSLTTTDIATMSSLLSAAASNVNASTTSIFTTLSTQAASNPTALAASGTSAQTLVVAATAVALSDAVSQGLSIADVINGTSTYTPSASVSTTLSNLASGVSAIDPGNALLSTLQSSFNITF